jgi:hypothetical protein
MSTFSNENHVTRGFTSDAINEFAFRLNRSNSTVFEELSVLIVDLTEKVQANSLMASLVKPRVT